VAALYVVERLRGEVLTAAAAHFQALAIVQARHRTLCRLSRRAPRSQARPGQRAGPLPVSARGPARPNVSCLCSGARSDQRGCASQPCQLEPDVHRLPPNAGRDSLPGCGRVAVVSSRSARTCVEQGRPS
jgi:hypothetical protein